MQDSTIQVPRTTSGFRQSLIRDRRKTRLSWIALRSLLSRFRMRLFCSWCIWKSAYDSFRGHIRTQSPRELPFVDFGPCLDFDRTQQLSLNTRTLARKLHKKNSGHLPLDGCG